MVNAMIGKKVGMTQLFAEDGSVVPATVIKAGPCVVVQRKTAATDGYESVQLGFVDGHAPKTRKPLAGHYGKANVPTTRVLREVELAKDSDPKVGDQILVDIFQDGEG